MAVAMKYIESAVAWMSVRISALEASATKAVSKDQVHVDTEIKAIMQRVNTLELATSGGGGVSASAPAISLVHCRGCTYKRETTSRRCSETLSEKLPEKRPEDEQKTIRKRMKR